MLETVFNKVAGPYRTPPEADSDDSGIIVNSKIKEVIDENKTNIPPHSAYKFCGFDPELYYIEKVTTQQY